MFRNATKNSFASFNKSHPTFERMRFLKLFFLFFFYSTIAAQAQPDTLQPPYKRFPTIPAFQILLGDSATFYKKENVGKGKPLLLMLFSPECSHCQHAAADIVQHKEELKGITIVMATMHTISQMNGFAETYGLKALPNVILGKDIYYTLPSFYGIRNLPFMAFYNKKGSLIDAEEGSLPMEKVIELFKQSK